jgi:hypothetical protein
MEGSTQDQAQTAQTPIVVPESVKRTKKERTPAQLQALAKGRDAHVEKSKLRREIEKNGVQTMPYTPPSTPEVVPEMLPRRRETNDFVELKNLKRELKVYKTQTLVRDLVADEVKRMKELKASMKESKKTKVTDVEKTVVEKPVITFSSRRYGMLSPI